MSRVKGRETSKNTEDGPVGGRRGSGKSSLTVSELSRQIIPRLTTL